MVGLAAEYKTYSGGWAVIVVGMLKFEVIWVGVRNALQLTSQLRMAKISVRC